LRTENVLDAKKNRSVKTPSKADGKHLECKVKSEEAPAGQLSDNYCYSSIWKRYTEQEIRREDNGFWFKESIDQFSYFINFSGALLGSLKLHNRQFTCN